MKHASSEALTAESPVMPTSQTVEAFIARVVSGAHAEAIKLYSAVAGMPGSEQMPVDYRLGVSLQALGQKDAAKAALTKFVSNGKGSKKSLEDAKQRLEKLAG